MPKHSLLAFLLLLCVGVTQAKEFIVCQRQGASDIVVTLAEFARFGRVFNCIAGEFVTDLSGCAPDGAFGLHAPTGSAALVGVVSRRQDYSDHTGGITSHFVTSHAMSFAGGFNARGSGYQEAWRFSMNRSTGTGKLEQGTAAPRKYACAKAARKF